ncbi:MAG: thiamine pyrophosphate-dependent enzyme, partial [Candidatus Omnitrophica bacterium]|nr:thiamine pyrophosphate-dependent enzyme [Candidatus Omnitrophota bacterium]
TLMGMGAFPDTDTLSLHMCGMHGTVYANHAIQDSDLLIAVGARFDDRVTGKIDAFAPKAKIAHIDIDPSSVSKNVRVDIPIVGDAKLVLQEIIKLVRKTDTKKWIEKISGWKTKSPLTYAKDAKLRPQFVVEEIYRLTKGEAIIATEVGQNQMWAAMFYQYTEPRTFISSGGLGTMGYGLPAAIGAKIGCPDRIVFDIAGDGSIQMNIQELATAVIEKVPVKVAILNNGFLGMVRQWQELFYGRRYSHVCMGKECYYPDFVKLAESYGAHGIRVSKKDDVEGAIKKALSIKGPVFIDFIVEQEENVFPMVPAGEAIHKMLGGGLA